MGKDRQRKKYHSEAIKPKTSLEDPVSTEIPNLVPIIQNDEKSASDR